MLAQVILEDVEFLLAGGRVEEDLHGGALDFHGIGEE